MKTAGSVIVGALLAGLLLMSRQARAEEGFRCESGRVVSAGDHMAEVRRKCGDPDAVTQRTEKRKVKHKVRRYTEREMEELTEEREVEVVVDEWIYDLGAERFIRYLAFENFRLVGVTTGDRGSQKQK